VHLPAPDQWTVGPRAATPLAVRIHDAAIDAAACHGVDVGIDEFCDRVADPDFVQGFEDDFGDASTVYERAVSAVEVAQNPVAAPTKHLCMSA